MRDTVLSSHHHLRCSLFLPMLALSASSLYGLDLSLDEQDIQPTVNIQEHENRVVEEYKVNNQTYMIKITPVVGAPYYLIDDTGSGDMEYRRDAGGRDNRVPQWVLYSW